MPWDRLSCGSVERSLQCSACCGRARQEQEGQRRRAGGCDPPLVLGPGSVSTFGFHSRDGQEVAVVYYREGYVPQVYDEQVSTTPFPRNHSWALPRELK